mmetsp:Transcript_38409/g.118709  ORF Transcript_38409/g.118709 Transcript_38409/m.118709 type:complete len:356 (-) Transcript_38409:1691-2758(-)
MDWGKLNRAVRAGPSTNAACPVLPATTLMVPVNATLQRTTVWEPAHAPYTASSPKPKGTSPVGAVHVATAKCRFSGAPSSVPTILSAREPPVSVTIGCASAKTRPSAYAYGDAKRAASGRPSTPLDDRLPSHATVKPGVRGSSVHRGRCPPSRAGVASAVRVPPRRSMLTRAWSTTTKRCRPSRLTSTPYGFLSCANGARTCTARREPMPAPAMVSTTCDRRFRRRTRWLFVSATKSSRPHRPTARPPGPLNRASRPAPSTAPVAAASPARVTTKWATGRTARIAVAPLAKYTVPSAWCTASPPVGFTTWAPGVPSRRSVAVLAYLPAWVRTSPVPAYTARMARVWPTKMVSVAR